MGYYTRGEDVVVMMVKFDNEESGRELRRTQPLLSSRYPGCTPIKKQIHKYSTSKQSRGVKSNVATVQQFPLILSFASTTHKIQGQTIKAPQKVAVDLQSVFGANQSYVMLGRTEERKQLYIIDKLPKTKIYQDKEALKQLEILKAKSLNKNPPVWERSYEKSVKVCFHNIHSLVDKIEDVKADLVFPFGDLLIFGETWLTQGDIQSRNPDSSSNGVLPTNYNRNLKDSNEDQESETGGYPHEQGSYFQLPGYKLHLNSRGRGKGLATYYKEKFEVTLSIPNDLLQMIVLEADNFCVICIYRSHGDKSLTKELSTSIPKSGQCLIIGDFNICSMSNPNHEVFTLLRLMGFNLLVTEATHFHGGKIDQAWLRITSDSEEAYNTELYSPYFNAKVSVYILNVTPLINSCL